MVRCGWVQKNILLFLENEMSPDIADKVGKHLLKCSHCSVVADQVEEVREPVKVSMQFNDLPPDSLQAGVMDRIQSTPIHSGPSGSPGDKRVPPVAWIIGALILFGALGYIISLLSGRA